MDKWIELALKMAEAARKKVAEDKRLRELRVQTAAQSRESAQPMSR